MLHWHFLLQFAAQQSDPDAPAPFAIAQLPSWFPFFKWVDQTSLSAAIKATTWVFPLVETFHILALSVLLGTVFLLDLRLLGLAIRHWSPAQIMAQVRPMMNWAVGIILVTGILLFVAEPRKCFDNAAFGPKMIFLALALLVQYTVYRRAGLITARIPVWARVAGTVSFALWFAVAVCGRAIGFV